MAVIFLGFGCTIAAGDVIYVDDDAPGPTHDGTTWTYAYLSLQDALNKPPTGGDEIWVAAATYKPGTVRTDTFQLISGVALYGGFPSVGDPNWNDRDPNAYETILSGDIGVADVNTDNSYHVVTGDGTDATAILDGFTITAGNANGSNPDDAGGGMFNGYGSPTVADCTFSGNSAADSGGMRNSWGSPTLTNCTFTGNSASWGGGIYNRFNCSPTVTNCTFSGNSASNAGGGLYNHDSSPTLTNCILWGNTAPTGPQIYNYFSATTVTYSDIEGGWGGTGNIDEDPLFIDPNGLDGIPGTADDEEGYVHLRGYSPCINAGDPAGDYSGRVDLDRQPRVAYGRVDMGADEVYPIFGDSEPDGDVDFYDFGYFANNWLLGVE